jgi:hypothetical protein
LTPARSTRVGALGAWVRIAHNALSALGAAGAPRFVPTFALTVAMAFGALGGAAPAHAASTRYCDEPAALTAPQKDQLFRFGAIVKRELDASGSGVAFIARSGLDLGRFGVRYSHAGLSMQHGLGTPWAVRQLYYSCDEQRPRVFDQGISAFLLGLNDPAIGYISIVLVPPAQADALERAVLDNRQALQLLGATYSANAYPFSLSYQNCNQWVAEMLAAAWGGLDMSDDNGASLRTQAQAWLQQQGYRPSVFDVGWRPLMWLAHLIPWLHSDDHPADDLAQALFRVSMPTSIEAFVQATVPGATRLELCHADRRVVIRRGWDALPDGCVPGADDTVVMLD